MNVDPLPHPQPAAGKPAQPAACANCEAALDGPFCAACGQRHRTERLSLGSLFAEFVQRLFNLDRGFLGTAKALTVAPGTTIRQYLAGRRRQVLNPFTYLVLATAISLIFHRLSSRFADVGIEASLFAQEGIPPAAQVFFARFVEWTFDHSLWITLAMAIPFTLACQLLFRRHRLHVAETAVFALFAFGHVQLLGSLIYLPSFVLPAEIWNFRQVSQGSIVVLIGYLVVAVVAFYGRSLGTIIKALVAAGAAWGSIFSAIAVGIGIFISLNPHLLADTTEDNLLAAVASKQPEVVATFLAEGATPNAERRQTALRLALESDSMEIARMLLAAGADPESRDGSSRSPLQYAIAARRPEWMKLLLAHGADPERRDQDGSTALMLASASSVRLVEPLLAAGAEVDAQRDAPLATALMIAANIGSPKRVDALLAAGADPRIVGSEGQNALDVAHSRVKEPLATALAEMKDSPP
ncbi:MAG: ankyrin repeat domain-containing protein [Acidobacteriota bacterium]